MKLVIRTVIFHFLCILFFGLYYFYFKNDFKSETKQDLTTIDCFFLSTTIQSGVGISDVYPTEFYGKIIMILQQFIMIMTNIFTIYIFTL